MKKALVSILALAAVVGLSMPAFAADAAQVKDAIGKARQGVITLLNNTDKSQQDTLNHAIHDASDHADAVLKEALAGADEAHKAKYAEVKSIWEAYKVTRDKELVPAILSGDLDKAKMLSVDVQKPRIAKIMELLQ